VSSTAFFLPGEPPLLLVLGFPVAHAGTGIFSIYHFKGPTPIALNGILIPAAIIANSMYQICLRPRTGKLHRLHYSGRENCLRLLPFQRLQKAVTCGIGTDNNKAIGL